MLVSLLALASCGSPRTNFYALAPVGPAASTPTPASACGGARPVTVERVLVPGTLDRQAIVTATGPERLNVSAEDRWAGPLDQMIQLVLAQNLRDRLPSRQVLAPGDPAPPTGAIGVAVNILRFMPDDAGKVTLRADWTLLDRNGAPLLTRSASLSAAAGPATSSAVTAMSGELGVLADRIAAGLGGLPAC